MWRSRAVTMTVAAFSVLSIWTSASAEGDHPYEDSFYVYAKVVRVEPLVTTIEVERPREVCWDEEVRHVLHGHPTHPPGHRQRSPFPTIVGGVVGGVVGNQIGRRHDGRGALTIAGTLLGVAVGHRIQSAHRHRHSPPPARTYTTMERRCEVRTEYQQEERVDGYDVTYRYNGRSFTTRMSYDPGERIRLRVGVEPTVS